MAYDPSIRASDADRDRAAALLREHHAAGRLTAEEFDERLDKAFEARTLGEIDGLLRDLPSVDLYRLPDAELTRQPRQAPRRFGLTRMASWEAGDLLDARLADRTEAPDASAERAEQKELLADAIEALPERGRLVVTLYYMGDLRLKEIGSLLNL